LTKNKVICALALISALACGMAPVKIADIKRNPERFESRAVTVHGKATAVTKLPFMAESFYEIDDGSGMIVVVTQQALPPEGKKVFVRGKVKSAFKVGGQSFGLIIMEEK
jgi:hypothetical protein